MRTKRRARSFAAMCLLAFLTGRVLAQQPQDCSGQETGGAMSESSYRVVELAIEDLSSDRFAEAEQRLLKVTDRAEGYERAVIYQTLGFVYAQQEQLKPALEAFEEALATKALPRQPQEDLMFNVGQIYVADEQYERGIETIRQYIQTACKEPPATANMMLANALAQSNQYEPALEQVQIAIGKVDQPEEQWLQLKLALHYELKQMSQTAETLVSLIAMSVDNAEYWKQLSGVLLDIEQQDESLAVLALAERNGLLRSERDLKNLASIYLMLEIPYKAGLIVERAMGDGLIEGSSENYEYLSDAWISAREWDRAEAALRQAAELAPDGDLWKRLAQVLMEKESWLAAQEALERSLDAGVSNVGQTHYLLGVAAYQAGDRRSAEDALRSATRDPSSRRLAQQWLDHIAANR